MIQAPHLREALKRKPCYFQRLRVGIERRRFQLEGKGLVRIVDAAGSDVLALMRFDLGCRNSLNHPSTQKMKTLRAISDAACGSVQISSRGQNRTSANKVAG